MSLICIGQIGITNRFGEFQNSEKRIIIRKRFDLVWAEHWTYVPYQQVANHINGRHAVKIMVNAHIYACIDSHHMFANVRIKRIHETVKKVHISTTLGSF